MTQKTCAQRTTSEQEKQQTGMLRAEKLYRIQSWTRNMGFPSGCGSCARRGRGK